MFCVKCGKENPDSGNFCWSCGNNLFKDAGHVQQDIVPPLPNLPKTANQLPPQEKDTAEPILATIPDQSDFAPIETKVSEAESASPTNTTPKELKGLGGWLILVAIGLVLGTCYWAYGIYQDVTLFNDGTVQFLSDPSSSVNIRGYSELLKFELIGEITMIAITVWLFSLFFSKSRQFPLYYTAFLIAIVMFAVLDYLLVLSASTGASPDFRKSLEETLSGQASQIPRSAIGALIWGFYMKKSERVKATFVN